MLGSADLMHSPDIYQDCERIGESDSLAPQDVSVQPHRLRQNSLGLQCLQAKQIADHMADLVHEKRLD